MPINIEQLKRERTFTMIDVLGQMGANYMQMASMQEERRSRRRQAELALLELDLRRTQLKHEGRLAEINFQLQESELAARAKDRALQLGLQGKELDLQAARYKKEDKDNLRREKAQLARDAEQARQFDLTFAEERRRNALQSIQVYQGIRRNAIESLEGAKLTADKALEASELAISAAIGDETPNGFVLKKDVVRLLKEGGGGYWSDSLAETLKIKDQLEGDQGPATFAKVRDALTRYSESTDSPTLEGFFASLGGSGVWSRIKNRDKIKTMSDYFHSSVFLETQTRQKLRSQSSVLDQNRAELLTLDAALAFQDSKLSQRKDAGSPEWHAEHETAQKTLWDERANSVDNLSRKTLTYPSARSEVATLLGKLDDKDGDGKDLALDGVSLLPKTQRKLEALDRRAESVVAARYPNDIEGAARVRAVAEAHKRTIVQKEGVRGVASYRDRLVDAYDAYLISSGKDPASLTKQDWISISRTAGKAPIGDASISDWSSRVKMISEQFPEEIAGPWLQLYK